MNPRRVGQSAGTQTRELAGITAGALCTRLLWLRCQPWELGDSTEYLQIANGLLLHGAFTADGFALSSYRPPLYPALLAAATALGGDGAVVVLLLQALVSALTVTLTYLVAAQWFSRRTALLAAVALTVAPMTGRYAALILTETIFTFLIVLGAWTWGRGSWLAAGCSFGAAALTRASMAPFLIVLFIAGLVPAFGGARRGCRVIAIAALLVVLPWVVRNTWHFGRPTIADAGWGLNLFYGTFDLRSGANRWEQLLSDRAVVARGVPTWQLEQQAGREALARIQRAPATWLRARVHQYPWLFLDTGDYLPVAANRYTFRRAVSEWHLTTVLITIGFVATNALVVLLAAYGLWMSRRRLSELLPVWCFPAFLAVAHLPMYVEPRYGLPLVPFLAIFAADAAINLLDRTKWLRCCPSGGRPVVSQCA
jgi:4-amino-4-deoxy-L-arabinose transferase-like glycosyltransferase